MKKLIVVLTLAVFVAFSATAVMADPGPYVEDGANCPHAADGTFTPCMAGNGYDVYNSINKVFTDRSLASPGFTDNAGTDGLQVTSQNEFWQQLSTEDSSEFAFISITAANTNTLGVFPNPGDATLDSTFFTLSFVSPGGAFTGSGSAADPYPGFVNPLASEDFGFSLRSEGTFSTRIFASEVAQNDDGIDHMLAFQLSDLAGQTIYVQIDGNGDGDLDDGPGVDDVLEIVLTEETFLIAWEDKLKTSGGFDEDYNDAVYLVTKIKPTDNVIPEPMSMLLFGSGIAALAGARRKRKLS